MSLSPEVPEVESGAADSNPIPDAPKAPKKKAPKKAPSVATPVPLAAKNGPPEITVIVPITTGDGRAVWIDGSNHAWVIDPEHPSGYMKLKLRQTSADDVASEAIVALGKTSAGHIVLAARDGAIAWTNRALRPMGERVPAVDLGGATPLAVDGDERWIYVLRPRGDRDARSSRALQPPVRARLRTQIKDRDQ